MNDETIKIPLKFVSSIPRNMWHILYPAIKYMPVIGINACMRKFETGIVQKRRDGSMHWNYDYLIVGPPLEHMEKLGIPFSEMYFLHVNYAYRGWDCPVFIEMYKKDYDKLNELILSEMTALSKTTALSKPALSENKSRLRK